MLTNPAMSLSSTRWLDGPGCRGFTLLELAVALALAGVLSTMAIRTYSEWIADAELANEAHHLADSMSLARSEAIKHGGRVNLCKSSDRLRCTTIGGWESGWVVFADDERSGQPGDPSSVVRIEPASRKGITARANQPLANYVSYTALGHARLLSGALQMGTFTVCKSGRRGYHVVLANSGRVRVERAVEVCA